MDTDDEPALEIVEDPAPGESVAEKLHEQVQSPSEEESGSSSEEEAPHTRSPPVCEIMEEEPESAKSQSRPESQSHSRESCDESESHAEPELHPESRSQTQSESRPESESRTNEEDVVMEEDVAEEGDAAREDSAAAPKESSADLEDGELEDGELEDDDEDDEPPPAAKDSPGAKDPSTPQKTGQESPEPEEKPRKHSMLNPEWLTTQKRKVRLLGYLGPVFLSLSSTLIFKPLNNSCSFGSVQHCNI